MSNNSNGANRNAYSIKFAGQEGTSGAVQEDSVLGDTGKLTAVDSDAHATLAWSVAGNGAGTYGSLSIDATGKWTYTLNNGAANVQALAAGEKVSETFTIKVTDNHGVSATQTVTMKITGSNDAPVISAAINQDVGVVQEDGMLKASGSLTGSDRDHDAHLSWSVVGGGDGAYGSLSINGSGKWTYKLDGDSAAVQALAQGEHASETFTVRLSDGQGGTDTHTVTIDIAGTNDAPKITGDCTVVQVKEDATLSASGHLNASDVDHGAHLAWSAANGGAGTYGSLTIDQYGNWSYALNNGAANVQALAEGDAVTDIFTVKVIDQFGASDTQTVTIKILGTDDAPVIAGTATGAVKEDAVASATGQLALAAVDHPAGGDDHHGHGSGHHDHGHGHGFGHDQDHGHDHSHGHHNHAGNIWSVVGSGVGTYGTFSVDQTGKWSYALNNSAGNVQALAEGESYIESFTVKVTTGDADHPTVTRQVQVTVSGTNDAPVIASTAQTGVVKEDASAQLTAGGQLVSADIDHGATATWSVDPHAASPLGSFAVVAGTGAWTYTLNNASPDVQGLVAGQSIQETYTVRVTDEHGASASQAVTVTVDGTNDGAVIGTPTVATVTEDASATTLTASGSIAISDADQGQSSFQAAELSGGGNLGTLSLAADGSYTYSVANSAVQYLDAGDSKVDTFTVTSLDGTTRDVSFTINGQDEAPTLSTPVIGGTAREGQTLTATPAVSTDAGATVTYQWQAHHVGDLAYSALDAPSATGVTYAAGINNLGEVAGTYNDASGTHGYLYSAGSYTTLDVPGAAAFSYATGINDAGEVVGMYRDGSGHELGFLYDGITFTTLANPIAPNATIAYDINNVGQIVGNYSTPTATHGFVYSGGVYTTLDMPGASGPTLAYGINDAGDIVGTFNNSSGMHGFLYSEGVYTVIDNPLAAGYSQALGINNAGQISGTYVDVSGGVHGYVYSDGTFTGIVNALTPGYTTTGGINDVGEVVGYGVNGGVHGYVTTAAWTDLSGETGLSHVVTEADEAAMLRIVASATGPAGDATATSAPTDDVSAAPTVTVVAVTPNGIDLTWASVYDKLANSEFQAGATVTQFTIVDNGAFNGHVADVTITVSSSGFTYGGSAPVLQLTGGTIDGFVARDSSSNALATWSGFDIDAASF